MNGGYTMKSNEVKKPVKVQMDFNPNSKSNREFRARHDISIPTFERLAKQYQAVYG